MKAACSVCTLDPAGAKVNGLNGRTPVPAREEEQKRTFPFERGKKESKLDHLGYESATEAILLLWVASCCHHLGCGRVSKWLTGSGDHSPFVGLPSSSPFSLNSFRPFFLSAMSSLFSRILSSSLLRRCQEISSPMAASEKTSRPLPPSTLDPAASMLCLLSPSPCLSLPLSVCKHARSCCVHSEGCPFGSASSRLVLCRHFLLEIMIKDGCVFQVRHSSLPFFLFLLSQRHFFLGRIERAAFFLFPSG